MSSGPSLAQGVPGVPQAAIVNPDGSITPSWYAYMVSLYNRTGGASGSISAVLDTLTNTVGSLLFRATTGWTGLAPGAQYRVLRMGTTTPEWDQLDGNSFPSQTANKLFASPAVGSGIASFRFMASSDLSSVAGAIPGVADSSNAAAGNVGEYLSISVPSSPGISLTTTVVADVASLTLSPGDWDVWAGISTTTALSSGIAWLSTVSVTDPGAPNSGAYASWQANGLTFPVGMIRQALAAPTTVYLSLNPTFSVGTPKGYGFIGARRVR